MATLKNFTGTIMWAHTVAYSQGNKYTSGWYNWKILPDEKTEIRLYVIKYKYTTCIILYLYEYKCLILYLY